MCKRVVLLVAAGLLLSVSASAATDLDRWLPSDPVSWMNFGADVAMDGDLAAVGAPHTAIDGLNYAGAVYLYRRQADGSWIEEAKLVRPIPEIHDNFGSSVAVSGDRVAVGAPDLPYSSFTGPGAVYVYRHLPDGSWIEEAELHGSNATVDSAFGREVVLDGGRLVVGANLASGGAAFAFEYSAGQWLEKERLQAPAGGFQWDGFGVALALQGDTLVVGASRLSTDLIPDAGKAFVYHLGAQGWSLDAELTAPAPGDGDRFGAAVAVDGMTLLVGAPDDKVDGTWEAGTVYVYKHTPGGWAYQDRLLAPVPVFGENFGSAVGVQGSVAAVGAPGSNLAGTASGAVYVFRFDEGWFGEAPFVPVGGKAQGLFGRSLAMQADLALFGAWDDVIPGLYGVGSVSLFRLDPVFTLSLDPLPPVAGSTADLQLRQGDPDTHAWVLYSTSGTGPTLIPALGVTVDLGNPKIAAGPVKTDATGSASAAANIPASAGGAKVWLQAVQPGRVSNLISTAVR